MNRLTRYILSPLAFIAIGVFMPACHDIPEYANDNEGNFDALWTILDEHYCFFEEKDVDWDEVYTRYRAQLNPNMGRQGLFNLCVAMLDELRDGHVNLSAPFATSYYTAWWSDYPQNFDERLIEEYYFNFNYRSLGVFFYGMLPQNYGYIRCSSFDSGLGEGNIDYILNFFALANGLIIDVRDNGGGSLTNVEDLVNRFITERTLVGYISHKTGPGHDEFSEPRAFHYDPIGDGHLRWDKPVVVLANRSTFSAANNFVSIMKLLPGVAVIGATTGGGSGMPYSSELPNGWGVRFSACSILDAQRRSTEDGVEPTAGCAVDMDAQDALNGHDTILDFAVDYLTRQITGQL